MITEHEAAALLGQANPVPDVDDYELGDLASVTINRLQEQTLSMDAPAQLKDARLGERRWAPIAASIILLVGLVFLLLRQADGSTVVTDPNPGTTIASSSSTTTPDASSTTSADAIAASSLVDIPVWLGSGDGQWTPARASVPFAFTARSGWNSANVWNTPDRFTICVPRPNSPAGSRCIDASVSVLRLDKGDVESTREFLLTFEGAEISNQQSVTVGGAPGIQFRFTHDISGTPGGQVQGDIGVPAAVDYGSEQIPIGVGPRGAGIVSIVDVGGDTMTVVYQGEEAARGAPGDGFNVNMTDGLQIVDSIIWGALE